MDEILGFNELKTGQRVKARGKWSAGELFGVVELSVKPSSSEVSLETVLQNIDHLSGTLKVFDKKIAYSRALDVKSYSGGPRTIQELHHGTLIKLKGRYSPEQGVLAKQIKVKEPRSFNIDILQGNIDDIDHQSMILHVAGFQLQMTPNTVITGL